MRNKKREKSIIDWKSKLIDLLIVIIGSTIAFQLNNLDESNKSETKERDSLIGFYKENSDNELNLSFGSTLFSKVCNVQ